MTDFISSLQDQMDKELLSIESKEETFLQVTHLSILAVEKVLTELRNYIHHYSFENTTEEIRFYKEIEPCFHARLIYYVRLYQVETCKPTGGNEELVNYYKDELKRIHQFFIDHKDFYRYYRSGSSFLDEMYFTRNSISSDFSIEEYSFILDTQFCTTQGFKVAKIIAYQRLQDYLEDSLCQLEQYDGKTQRKNDKQLSLQWTASKTDLIELLYGLQSVGVFNNSQADVKKIAGFLEEVFQVSLGNYYRVFQEIRIRKKSRTGFLDKMRETLVRRMDETDLRE